MRYPLKYVWFFFASTILNDIYAQVPDTLKKWNIQDCFQYAAAHNIQISTLHLDEQLTLQDLSLAKAVKIPSLSATLVNVLNNANNPYGNGNLVNQLTSTGNYSLNSSIVVWNDHYVRNNIRQRELLTQSAGLSVRQSFNNITLLITQAYLGILLSKENQQYATDLVNTSAARVKQGQQLYDAGSIAKKDLLQLQAQFAGDKYLLVQIQNSIRQNILSLQQILQLPADTSFDIAIPVSVEAEALIPPLQTVKQTALQNFPEIKIGRLGLDVASLDIVKSKAGFKPVLTANGALGTGYSDVITNSSYPKTGYFKQTGNNFYQRLGLTLSIPIFSNRVNTTNLEKANIAYQQADLNLQNEQLVLSQAVEQAYLNAVNARQAYAAAEQQLQAVAESYRIVNEQFKLGGINAYDLLQQRNQYVQAVQAFTQAKYAAVLQQKIYEFYMGKPVTL